MIKKLQSDEKNLKKNSSWLYFQRQQRQNNLNKTVLIMTKKTWAMLCHLTALSFYVGVPFGNILGPLIIWLIKKDEMPTVDKHGKESLNFQISMTIYGLIASLLIFVFIGFLLVPIVVIAQIIFVVIASIKANNGEFYNYPLTIRFIK